MPYQDLTLSPAAMVFHYGQEMFEGLKAYKGDDGANYLFRPDMNAKRTNDTNDRLCIPRVPEEDYVQAVKAIVSVDQDWIPTAPAPPCTSAPLSLPRSPSWGWMSRKPSSLSSFSPPRAPIMKAAWSRWASGLRDDYVRAVRGGMGFAKTGGNYAASLAAQVKAHDDGYSQVLWLDGVERKYIEEVGAMNIFFKIDGKVVTPMLNGSILPGIT